MALRSKIDTLFPPNYNATDLDAVFPITCASNPLGSHYARYDEKYPPSVRHYVTQVNYNTDTIAYAPGTFHISDASAVESYEAWAVGTIPAQSELLLSVFGVGILIRKRHKLS